MPSVAPPPSSQKIRELLTPTAIVAVVSVAAVGLLLAFQGWNSRLMNFDHINFTAAADDLLAHGTLPARGDVSSYLAFNTPGPAWLMLPGMLIFQDPRLYEAVGSAALYIGSLFGLFLLARMCFGTRCAYLAVVLYGLSRNGLFFAGSLWSIGHPFFYIWEAYFCLLWVRRNNANYLAAALVAWSVGMFVDMVLAPAIFMVPAIWVVYRPRVRLAPLLVALCATTAVWYPYLRFEGTRGFVDLKSLVARQRIGPANYKASWCMPGLAVHTLGQPMSAALEPPAAVQAAEARPPASSLYQSVKKQIRSRVAPMKQGLIFNFDQMTWTPLAALPLFLLAMTTVTVAAAQSLPRFGRRISDSFLLRAISGVSLVLLLLALLVNEFFIARFLSVNGSLQAETVFQIRAIQAALLVIGVVVWLTRRRCVRLAGRLFTEEASRPADGTFPPLLFSLAVIVPWLILLAVVEADNYSRYFWLWPLQTVLLAAAVTYVPKRFGCSRSVMWSGQIVLAVLLLTHPWAISPIKAWAKSGWSGPRATDVEAMDFIGSEVRSEGRNTVAIGYQTYIAEFMASQNIVEPRYKVGGELDMYLKHRYGISNSDQCAEGVSSKDEYRLVQNPPHPRADRLPLSWEPLGSEVKSHTLDQYFPVPRDPDFRAVGQFGEFQVFRRIPAP